MYGRKRRADGIELGFVRLAQKFQRDVHSCGPDPASALAFRPQTRHQLAKRTPNSIWNIERDEESHSSSASMRGEQKISADGVERLLRGLKADALTVAGEAGGAFAAATIVGDADVNQAHGLFGRSPAGAGNSGDADTECSAGAFANAVS